MSTTQTDSRPAHRASTDSRPLPRPSSNDCPTEIIPTVPTVPTVPVRRSILHAATAAGARAGSARPFADWRGQAQTEELPAAPTTVAARSKRRAVRRELKSGCRGRRPRVSTSAKPTGSRVARHLRAALAGVLIAAALLGGLQLLALDGIASARQAALAEQSAAQHDATAASAAPAQTTLTPTAEQPAARPAWVTEDTGAAYDRTDPAATPLGLPRCTTSPDTPLPCLATISPDSTRVVVLEEDASLTALVRR